MAWLAMQQGEFKQAQHWLGESVRLHESGGGLDVISQAMGVTFIGPWSSANLGYALLREGTADYAEDTFTAVQHGSPECGSKIDAEIIAAATTEGQAMTMDQAVACAREQRTA